MSLTMLVIVLLVIMAVSVDWIEINHDLVGMLGGGPPGWDAWGWPSWLGCLGGGPPGWNLPSSAVVLQKRGGRCFGCWTTCAQLSLVCGPQGEGGGEVQQAAISDWL